MSHGSATDALLKVMVERDEARAEVARLQAALALTTEDRDHCERTYSALQERLEDTQAERNRLKAALAIYADQGNWGLVDAGVCDHLVWFGDAEKPWSPAQEALLGKEKSNDRGSGT